MKKILGVYLITSLLLLSCAVKKKMDKTRAALDEIEVQKQKEKLELKSITDTANSKYSLGKIDQNIDSLFKEKLNGYAQNLDSIQTKIASIDTLLSNKKAFNKNYQSYVLPLLDTLNQLNIAYTKRTKLYAMVENALNIADFRLFDLAAFFGPGKYSIPEDKLALASESFSPIVDSMMKFSNQYKDIPKTGTLVILGFADGMGFSTDAGLLDTLNAAIGKTDPSKEELNIKLSEFRAIELVEQLKKIFSDKASSFDDFHNLSIKYIPQGKGEAYPLPYIKDYTNDDPRRRIVLCYWIVLPD